eukprot:3787260-Pyramimonas_sp.AAC.1
MAALLERIRIKELAMLCTPPPAGTSVPFRSHGERPPVQGGRACPPRLALTASSSMLVAATLELRASSPLPSGGSGGKRGR